jgi:hypothetical protein
VGPGHEPVTVTFDGMPVFEQRDVAVTCDTSEANLDLGLASSSLGEAVYDNVVLEVDP